MHSRRRQLRCGAQMQGQNERLNSSHKEVPRDRERQSGEEDCDARDQDPQDAAAREPSESHRGLSSQSPHLSRLRVHRAESARGDRAI